MKKLLAFVAISVLPLLSACSTSQTASLQLENQIAQSSPLANLPTEALETRHFEILQEIAAIEHEVELKAGLHMGVFISDERSRLTDLHRESQAIRRELLRRNPYNESLQAKL